ncbi:ABC transporter substrate-binding protein [Mesorhizobium erdmanii]|uniref:ABC transporter substrate-binding protein n=1 Tax=Mesorhizobium erdmanii TaxID=1777866 RepID=UPI00047CE75D|nr:extracellular solute-binding protein [Mesorhizobium erdmanii]
MNRMTRRQFTKLASSAAVLSTAGPLSLGRALAAEKITAVEWGGAYLDASQAIAAKQTHVDVNWQRHAGGAMVIMSKIKSTWPKPGIDLLSGWDPSWQMVAKEGWAEPVTLEQVPNLADIPPKLLVKDGGGNIVNIPRTVASTFWIYRKDTIPFEITKVEDLLDPRLKGKICWNVPSLGSNLQMVMLALHKGGDERNLEPAWDFVKELARSGNIGRVANSDQDMTSSISTGETSMAFAAAFVIKDLARNFQLHYLNKMDTASGFRTFIYQEGWTVLKGGNTKAAFDFANFAISPENDATFNQISGAGLPANVKSVVSEELKPFSLNSEEMNLHAYIPDWAYLSEQEAVWQKRWEQEIAPLL